MTYQDFSSDPLHDVFPSTYTATAYAHPAPKPTSPTMARTSFRPAPAPSRPVKRDVSPGSVQIPVGLSFSIFHRRDALSAGMTQAAIDTVMAEFRSEQAGELRTPREWGSLATTAIMDAIRAHRAGTQPEAAPEPVEHAVVEPEAAPIVEPQPEAAPATAADIPNWDDDEWDGEIGDVLPVAAGTMAPETVVVDEVQIDDDHIPETEMREAPEPAAQPIEAQPKPTQTDEPATELTTTKPVMPVVKPAKPREGKEGKHPKYAFGFSLMADPNLKPSSKVVGLYLVDLIDVKLGHAYPSREQVMAATGMTIDMVKRAYRDLRGSWFDSYQRNGSDRNQWVPMYTHPKGDRWKVVEKDGVCKIVPACIDGDDDGRGAPMHPKYTPTQDREGHPCTPFADADETRGASLHPKGGTHAPLGGAQTHPSGGHPCTPNTQEHSDQHADKTRKEYGENEARDALPVRTRTGFDRDWIVFAKAYPAAVDDTWRPLFMRVRSDGWSMAQILEGIDHMKSNLCEGQVPYNVAAFLGREMWTDAYTGMTPEHHEMESETRVTPNAFDLMDMESALF